MFHSPGLWALLVLVIIFVLSAVLTQVLVRFRLLALPNARSAHQIPIPTAGGLAMVVAVIVGLAVLTLFTATPDYTILVLFGIAAMAALLGLIDDAKEVSAKIKFTIIGILSLALAVVFGPVTNIHFDQSLITLPWIIGVAGSALWAFTLINAVNFMDGADGVIPLSALCAALGLAVLGALFGVWGVCWSGLVLAAALVGFLPFNLPRAQIFLGDTGALFVGAWLAGTALLLIREGPPAALWLMPLLMMPWLSDVLLTLAWRLLKRRNLLRPHQDHLYQWALARKKVHFPIAVEISLQILIVCALAIIFRGSATSAFLAFAATASLAILVHWQVRKAK